MTKVQIKSEKLTPLRGFFPIIEQFVSMLSSVVYSILGLKCFFVFFSKNIHFTMLPLQVRCKSVVSPFLYWDKKQRHDEGK